MSQPLQALQLPLIGTHLIEASAGTGKTYTLAMLYLRLVLNHGGSQAFGRTLLPNEILVVTFTKAATKELKERIRTRLVEAADCFNAADAQTLQRYDEQLQQLRQAYPDPIQRRDKTQQLLFAAESMDEAAVSTIHAWCFRILNEFALYYGGTFESQELASENQLMQQACEDFWRLQVLNLPAVDLAHFLQHIASPQTLQKHISRLLPHMAELPHPNLTSLASLISQVTGQLATIDQQLLAPKQQLREGALQQLQDFFAKASKQKLYNGNKLSGPNKDNMFARVQDYLMSDHAELDISGVSMERFALIDKTIWRDPNALNFTTPLSAVVTLCKQKASLSAKHDSLIFAMHWIAQRLQAVKFQQGLLSLNDQLTQLQQALASSKGKALAEAIRQRFPVAMVDEFQDTDPIQYEIFSRIYQLDPDHQGTQEKPSNPAQKPNTGFIMIGDPKQAIYSFRGGDIYTYLRAKAVAKNNLYTLSHNFRSDQDVIASVNALFTYADQQPAGAFRFAKVTNSHEETTQCSQTDNPLPFLAVQAGRPKPKKLILNTPRNAINTEDLNNHQLSSQPSLGAWLMTTDKGLPTKNQFMSTMANHCANAIADLLNLSQQGLAYLVDGNTDTLHPEALKPSHMAVLVADKDHAAAIRRALSQRHIASVYLSDRSNVYQTNMAKELLYVLQAIAEPTHNQTVGMALATQIMGASLDHLHALQEDELLWEAAIQKLYQYQAIWQQKSLQACVYQVLFDQHTAQRLQTLAGGQINGERQLTDLLHLVELLQQASRTVYGQQPLLRHFEDLINQAIEDENNNHSSEATQQRLESDGNLVQVVTYFKAKGLEYPVVFLPFICDSKSISSKNTLPYVYHDATGQKQVSLSFPESNKASIQNERQAEEVRKLYVALTRASHCQYIGLANNKNFTGSGLGALFNASKKQPNIDTCLADLNQHITLLETPAPCQWQSTHDLGRHTQPKPARTMPKIQLSPWRIASYSALHFHKTLNASVNTASASADLAPENPKQAILQEETSQQSAVTANFTRLNNTVANMHNLPKGALYGTFLHEVLEWCAVQGFAKVIADADMRRAFWQQKLASLQLQPWQEALDDWLCEFLTQPWDLSRLGVDAGHTSPVPQPLTLANIPPQHMSVEMEFMFSAHHLDIHKLDLLVCAHTWGQTPRPQAQAQHINGLMKGFIDMVIEHQGQYFIIDWKSNYLGEDTEAYYHSHLQTALLDKRYDMQYILYILALHRLLKLRLPHYDYEQHIGGAIYAYLRGYQNTTTQGLIMDKPSLHLIEALDNLFKGNAHNNSQGVNHA